MEWLPLVRWLLVLAALTVIGAPLSAWLFPDLPGRGGAFALPVALIPVALVTFLLGQVTFGRGVVLAGVAVAAAAGYLAHRAGARPSPRAVAGGFAVFAAAFLFLVSFRASAPGVTPRGGEQFLHFGLTKAIARAPALPPEDFWFAGRPLKYYYGTQLQVTALSLLAGVPLRYGFTLGPPTFYGVLAAGAYGLAGSVTAAAGHPRRLGGLLGVVFTAVGGASTTAVRLAFGILPADTAVAYGRAAFAFAASRSPASYPEMVAEMSDPGTWGWWYTRYVVPDTLQEFPMYSFVKADLHGHALSTGYVVFAAALAYSYYRLPARRLSRRVGVLLGLGVVAGVFGFMNTWSLPTAVGLAWLAVAAADPHPTTLVPGRLRRIGVPRPDPTDGRSGAGDAGLGRELSRLALGTAPAVAVGVVGVVLSSPFLVFGSVPENDGIGFLPPSTPLPEFLVIYGALLALFVGFVLSRFLPAVRGADRDAVGVAAVALGAAAVGAAAGIAVAAVTAPLLVVAWWLVRTERAGFEAVLLVAGVGLLLSMELVYARVAPEELVRWNTTLKVAVQGWTLAGVAAGAAAAILLSGGLRAIRGVRARAGGGDRDLPPASAVAAVVLVAVVVLASLPFPVLAAATEIGPTLEDGEFTIDAMDPHERWRPAQTAALDWLADRAGTPTIVEAPGRRYQWSSPASVFSGLPSLVGWVHHQRNYRDDALVERRAAAADAVYVGNWSRASAVLADHDVAYVYVGPVERERYGAPMREFGARRGLSPAFRNEAVTIYRVNRTALPGAGPGRPRGTGKPS